MSSQAPEAFAREKPSRVRHRPALGTWTVPVAGSLVLVVVGLLLPIIIPSTPPQAVPQAVLEAEQARTMSAAQSVRRGLNEALDDLSTAAFTLSDGDAVAEGLVALADERRAYRGLAWITADGEPIRVGDDFPVPALPVSAQSVILEGERDREPFVRLIVPVPGRPGEQLVAWFDARHLSFPLDAAGPGERWLVDGQNRVLASTEGFLALQALPSAELDDAAVAARTDPVLGVDLPAAALVVSGGSVTGEGPGGSVDWAVVTSSSYESLALTDSAARKELLLVGLLTVVASLLVLGWFLVVVALPLRHLARDATALADGRLAEPVVVRRYDEVGVIGRNLDRIRRVLRGELYGYPDRRRSDRT